MNKTIIAVYGRQREGKSATIKLAFQQITLKYSQITFEKHLSFAGDILTTVKFNGIKIGFESQGNPNSRIIYDNTLEKLADKESGGEIVGCDLIVCATRTEGATVKKWTKLLATLDITHSD